MFSSEEIADYYDTTIIHYEQWWKLRKGLSLHYGIRDSDARSFTQSLANTNKVLMDLAGIGSGQNILDAGCGVGGAAIYLAEKANASVTGITLSEKQVKYASERAREAGLGGKVEFLCADYTNTPFMDGSFDVVWACESISSAKLPNAFLREARRLLKPGGKLVLSDFFLTRQSKPDRNNWIRKWCDTWSMSALSTEDQFLEYLERNSLMILDNIDYSSGIMGSSKRLYIASILGSIPSELYNLFHPGVSRFARHHYRSGYFQYKALMAGLWQYRVMLALKLPDQCGG